jgi:hypothetical protein
VEGKAWVLVCRLQGAGVYVIVCNCMGDGKFREYAVVYYRCMGCTFRIFVRS